jgi:hypothetical protein
MSTQDHPLTDRCIWMDAGMLRYRLCDRGFDCEHCPLDAALRNLPASADPNVMDIPWDAPADMDPVLRGMLAPLERLTLRRDRLYSAGHLWMRTCGARCTEVGMDSWLSTVLPADAVVVTTAAGTDVAVGGEFAWVYAGGGVLPLRSPLAGVQTLHRSKEPLTIGALREGPYSRQLLGRITPGDDNEDSLAPAPFPPGMDAAEMEWHTRRDCDALAAALTRRITSPGQQFLLNDGGLPVSTVAELLGPDALLRLIASLLSSTPRSSRP